MTLNRVRLYKEFRAISFEWMLGVFGIVVFALAARFTERADRQSVFFWSAFGIYIVIANVLGAMSFGNEFDCGAMEALLSRSIPRSQIWREKILVLLLFLATLLVVHYMTLVLLMNHMSHDSIVFYNLFPGLLVVVFAGIGGVFFSLLLRQTHLAVWCSMFAPFMTVLFAGVIAMWSIYALDQTFFRNLDIHPVALVTILALSWFPFGYAFFGYYFARRLFFSLETFRTARVTKYSKREDSVSSSGITQGTLFPYPHNPWISVIVKEIHLQKATLYFALFIFLSWAMVAGMALESQDPWWRPYWGSLSIAIVHMLLFYLLPLAIGAFAISWELNSGIAGWQHSLPLSRRSQWAIKVLLCLSLTACFSWVLGVNLELAFLHRLAGPKLGIPPADNWSGVLALGVMTSGLYASTLAKSTLLAFLGGMLVPTLTSIVFNVGGLYGFGFPIPPAFSLPLTITGTIIISAVVYIFSYWNYIRRWEGMWWTVVQVVVWLGGAFTMGWIAAELR